MKKKSTAGEDEAGIYNKKILIMSLITLQQNHSSVHRVPAMTVKGNVFQKTKKITHATSCLATLLVTY